MKKNTSLLTGLYVLGFTVSGLFTAMCLCSMAQSKESKILVVIMAVIFEFAKAICFFEWVSDRHSGKLKNMFFIAWVITVSFSLFASIAFSLNETNQSINKNKINQIVNKDEKESKNLAIKSQKKSISKIENDIEDLKKIKDSLPSSYRSKKLNIQKQINFKSDQIVKLNNNLIKLADKKVSYVKLENTSGYLSILEILKDILNKSKLYLKEPYTVKELELGFFFLLSVALELIICLFYYLKNYTLSPNMTQVKSMVSDTNKNDIRTQDYNENDIKKYIDVMYDNSKDNISIGQSKIEQLSGLKNKQVRFIRNYLDKLGIIKIEGNTTHINLDKEQALKEVTN